MSKDHIFNTDLFDIWHINTLKINLEYVQMLKSIKDVKRFC